MRCGIGNVLPNILGHVTQHRCDRLCQILHSDRNHRLTTPAAVSIRSADVQSILGNIQIETRQVHCTEILHSLEESGKLEVVKSIFYFRKNFAHSVQHIAIEFRQIFVSHSIFCRIEVVQIPQQKLSCIANLAVNIRLLFENVFAQRHICGVVYRRHPQPQNIGSIFLNYQGRIDDISFRFAHLAAFFIQHKTVSQNCFVRSDAVSCYAGE